MPVVIELGPAASRFVAPRVSPLAELCACLHALQTPGHHPASRRWADAVRQDAEPALLDRAAALSPLWGAFRARYLLPLSANGERELAEEIGEIAALPREEFTGMTAQALLGKNTPRPEEALRDPGRFLARLRQHAEDRFTLGARLLSDTEGLRETLTEFLHLAGEQWFGAEWERLAGPLGSEVRGRFHEHRQDGAAVLAGFPTARVLSDPPRVEFEKLYQARVPLSGTPCLLVPSLHVNPHVAIKHYPGFPIVVQYPVRGGDGAGPPSLDVVRERLKVLHEPLRVDLCRTLLREAMTTTELATQYRMTPPQMSRHLRRLRESGLVVTHRRGARVHYQLDQEAVRNLGADLLAALHR
ncbi:MULTISPECIES: DUF5937 family protein [unclassified Streptomyces]|uniref:ArsR/SmtB family transcription factor n=1 Tax=unclassified Streptomyces TaxID=2593676 RepID=UPI002E1981D0|nr:MULTISPECIES: DUF5937 family protein [unclassified Streptomyces]